VDEEVGGDGPMKKVIGIVLIAIGIVLVVDLIAWLWAGNGQLWRLVFGGVSPTIRGWF
jgi:hypothetical protein